MVDDYRGIYGRIDHYDEDSEADLKLSCESSRVQDRRDVMLEKAAGVTGFTASLPPCDLEWSERTDRAGALDERAPEHGRNMQPGPDRPPQHQQATEHHEGYEAEMQHQDEIGHDPREHG
jgi:hypothetical protein